MTLDLNRLCKIRNYTPFEENLILLIMEYSIINSGDSEKDIIATKNMERIIHRYSLVVIPPLFLSASVPHPPDQ